jgi:1-acyl-sn-glycerol-3-phosphate acyltransferase
VPGEQRDDADDRQVGRLYTVARAVLSPLMRSLYDVRCDGLEHVPADGPALICPNHISFVDSLFVPLVLPRRITYVGKAEYLDSWKTRYLLPALGMIPIDRTGGSASDRALNAAARILERGELFGIYPEGTRSRTGKLYKGHTGPARLALRTGAPIVPVGIRGTDAIQPPDAKAPKPRGEVEIRIGRPIDVERYRGRSDDRLVLRQLTDELMYEIAQLSGQDYVDEYATKKADAIPTEKASIGPRTTARLAVAHR